LKCYKTPIRLRSGQEWETILLSILMRFVCAVAITFGLSFPAAGTLRVQDPAAASPSEKAPAEPAASAEKLATETSPPPSEKKAPENTATPKNKEGSKVETPSTPTAKGKAKRRRRPTAEAADGAPRKIVVREGGASEPAAQMAPGMSPAEAARERQNVERLLGSVEEQLKTLADRPLDLRQQETTVQIRNYMDGVRQALKEGDVRRADTLAQKAHLLADDLVRR
jgi:hypothetical protein